MDRDETAPGMTSRRALFAGAGAIGVGALLSGCGDNGDGDSGDNGRPGDEQEPALLAEITDVEVGGGYINTDENVVVTQPEAGDFRAFSAICTHQGCTVGSVGDGTINCPCHFSQYSIEDGSVVQAAQGLTIDEQAPLPRVEIVVEGDSILRA